MIRQWVIALVLVCNACILQAQDTSKTKVLALEEFLEAVRTYHPVARQAGLQVEQAKSRLQASRGNFDPVLSASFSKKKFGGEPYYQYWNPEVRVPTWYGVELYAGTEEIYGTRVTTENTLGQTSYAGIAVPLMRNLFFDKRRASLQQARIMRDQSEAEKRLALNELMFGAISSYWDWVAAYGVYQFYESIVQVNEARLELVKIGYRQGDRPAIDTLEALAQLRNVQYNQQKAFVEVQNSKLALSAFLWLPGDSSYLLPDNIIPDTGYLKNLVPAPLDSLDKLVAGALVNHPKLQSAGYKIDWLEIDRKYKFQQLLPYLNMKANLLSKGYDPFKNFSSNYLNNNYSLGMQFIMPLRLSEARGNFKEAKLKIQSSRLQYDIDSRDIETKIRTNVAKALGLHDQVGIYEKMYTNYQTLLKGESLKFNIGESSLFLLNSRENKMLETGQNLIELKLKYYKSLTAIDWSTGQLF